MKIISLNTWGGTIHKPLLDFIHKHKNIDVFCFQEMWHDAVGKKMVKEFDNRAFNLFSDIKVLLPHSAIFRPCVEDYYGLAIFLKKEFALREEGEFFVYKEKGYVSPESSSNHGRSIQYIKTEKNGKPITIINVHGLWNGKGKSDTEDRIEQSRKILEFAKTLNEDFILCGDFNLLPDTESIKMIEDFGLRNLIKEYNVTSTRTSHYTKPLKFADYIFTTKGIKVKDFKVLPDEVSDHAALYLEIDI